MSERHHPSQELDASRRGVLVEGLTLLRDAALLMAISSFIVNVGMLATFFGMWAIVPPQGHFMPFLGFWASPLAAVVGVVIGLYALFGKLIPSTTKLTEYDPGFSTGAALIKVGYVGGLTLLPVGFVTLILFIGVLALMAAVIFLLIGSVGIAVLSLKMYSMFDSTAFLAAGVLFFVGILMPIVRFVAWILVYAEASALMGRITRESAI